MAEKKITKRIGWQATMQNWTAGPSSTLNLESLQVTVPEIWPGQNLGGKNGKKKNNKANWMVSNSAQLDRRSSSTLNLESLRVTVPEIWPRQYRDGKKKITKRIGW